MGSLLKSLDILDPIHVRIKKGLGTRSQKGLCRSCRMSDRREDLEKCAFCLQARRASLTLWGPRGQSWTSGGSDEEAWNGDTAMAGM